MNRYRVLLPLRVHTPDASYEQFEEFDHEFSAEDEATNVSSGLLGIVPREYKVVGTQEVHGAKPGETFKAGLTIALEAALIGSGHIERIPEKKPTTAKPPAKPVSK